MRVFASLLVIAAAAYIGYVVITSNPTPSPEAPDAPEATGEVAAEPHVDDVLQRLQRLATMADEDLRLLA